MPNGHMILHMVAMVTIAVLLKQLVDSPGPINQIEPGNQKKVEPTTEAKRIKYTRVQEDEGTIGKDDTDPPSSSVQSSKHNLILSSVWCYNSGMCRFTNLCYNSDVEEFVMFHDENSVFENINIVDGSLTVDLSSVKGHNVYQLTVASMTSKMSELFNVRWVQRKTLAFKRFLAGNLMHVFHDDLFPLYHSLLLVTLGEERPEGEPFHVQIFLFENYQTDLTDAQNDHVDDENELNAVIDDIDDMYAMFSKWNLTYKNDFHRVEGLTCFKDIYVGLSRTTTWYDFGFIKPQGPVSNVQVSSRDIHNTVQFMLHQFGAKPQATPGGYLILFTRKDNRKILNEMELTLRIVQQVKMKVLNLDYESHSLADLMRLVGNARGIVGMHGSLLILSAFLKPGSVLVELFPYAVNPDNYTPYKTLANLKGMNIVYKAWSNQNAAKSYGHPDWSPELGGLMHIGEHQREIIMQQTDVPPHVCCSDPSWLYHIYQDTEVDSGFVTSLVDSSLMESDKLFIESIPVFYPSKVHNVICNVHEANDQLVTLTLTWDIPWTVAVTINKHIKVTYDVLIQSYNDKAKPVIERQVELPKLTLSVDADGSYVVWVRCVLNDDNSGPFSDARSCS